MQAFPHDRTRPATKPNRSPVPMDFLNAGVQALTFSSGVPHVPIPGNNALQCERLKILDNKISTSRFVAPLRVHSLNEVPEPQSVAAET